MQFHSKIQDILGTVKDDFWTQIDAYVKLKSYLTDESLEASSPIEKIKFVANNFEKKGLKFLESKTLIVELSKNLNHLDDVYLKGLVIRGLGSAQGFSLKFVKLGNLLTIQSTSQNGDSSYFSVRDGDFLTPNETLDLLNISPNLEELTFNNLLWSYLDDLAKKLESQRHVVALLKTYSALLHLNETCAQALLRRSLIYAKLGLNYEALSDMKRYLQFQPKSQLTDKVVSFCRNIASKNDDETSASIH